jgi:predicted ABC-type ATPase
MKVRVFAGPNGSGKSTLIYSFEKGMKLNMGFIINADNIENELNTKRLYTFSKELILDSKRLQHFLEGSTLNSKYNIKSLSRKFTITKNNIILSDDIIVNSYVSAAIADLLRIECLKQKINFSFESVFSDFRKVLFLKKLKEAGYDIYFYFVCTLNPSINIARIKERVINKGHNVSEEKVKSRFKKSIKNALKSKQYCKRFFLIDNSQENNPELLLELENNKKINFINKTFYPEWAVPFSK